MRIFTCILYHMKYNPSDLEVNRNLYPAYGVLRREAATYHTPQGLLAVSHDKDVPTILPGGSL